MGDLFGQVPPAPDSYMTRAYERAYWSAGSIEHRLNRAADEEWTMLAYENGYYVEEV